VTCPSRERSGYKGNKIRIMAPREKYERRPFLYPGIACHRVMEDGDRFLDVDWEDGDYSSLLEIVDSCNRPLSERIRK
jgi:hypothetical protein